MSLFMRRELETILSNNKIDVFLNKHNKFGIPFNAFFSDNYPRGIILSELLSEKEILDTIKKIKQ